MQHRRCPRRRQRALPGCGIQAGGVGVHLVRQQMLGPALGSTLLNGGSLRDEALQHAIVALVNRALP